MKKSIIIILMAFGVLLTGCQSDKVKPSGEELVMRTAVESWNVYIEDGDGEPQKAYGTMNGWFNHKVWMAYYVDDYTNPAVTGLYQTPTFEDLNYVPWGRYGVSQDVDRINLLEGVVVMGTGHTAFYPTMHYPTNNYVYMRGFYPQEGIVGIDKNTPQLEEGMPIEWILDGQQDIMVSNAVWGRNANGEQFEQRFQSAQSTQAGKDNHPDGRLEYHHLLSRMAFRVMVSTGWPKGLGLTAIELRGLHNRVQVDLSQKSSLDYSRNGIGGGNRQGWTGAGIEDTEASHLGLTNPNGSGATGDGTYDDGMYLSDPSDASHSFWTRWSDSKPFDVSIYTSAWSEAMAYMMLVPYEHFDIYFHFYNAGDGTREIVRVGNFTPAAYVNLTRGEMQKGKSYIVSVTLKLVNFSINAFATWEQEYLLGITSPGTNGGFDVGDLDPEENRWW